MSRHELKRNKKNVIDNYIYAYIGIFDIITHGDYAFLITSNKNTHGIQIFSLQRVIHTLFSFIARRTAIRYRHFQTYTPIVHLHVVTIVTYQLPIDWRVFDRTGRLWLTIVFGLDYFRFQSVQRFFRDDKMHPRPIKKNENANVIDSPVKIDVYPVYTVGEIVIPTHPSVRLPASERLKGRCFRTHPERMTDGKPSIHIRIGGSVRVGLIVKTKSVIEK